MSNSRGTNTIEPEAVAQYGKILAEAQDKRSIYLVGGPRPGAPMTSACLTLLREAECPIWPWDRAGPGLLVEAFPAAQLCQWKVSHQGYGKDDATASLTRKNLVSQLSKRIGLSSFKGKLEESADALDAVLCAFAASGVTTDNLVRSPDADDPLDEGLIAVCK
jgi:hypothetical protein